MAESKYLDRGGVEHLWSKIKSWVNTNLETWGTNKLGNFVNTGNFSNSTTIKAEWTAAQGHHFRIGDLDIVYSEGTITRLNKVLGNALLLFAIALYNDNALRVSFITSGKQNLKYTLINSFVKAGTISKDSSNWVEEEDGSFRYTTSFTNLTDTPTILFVW